MAATGEAARRLRVHSAGRKSGVEAPLQTVITTQDFRPGCQRFFVIAGVVALLLVLGGIALAFGFSSNEPVAENRKKDAAVSDSKTLKNRRSRKTLKTCLLKAVLDRVSSRKLRLWTWWRRCIWR